MGIDWVRWHETYDDPASILARRLVVVRGFLDRALSEAPAEQDGRRQLISLCCGDGRDTLPVLAAHEAGRRVRAVLTELNPELARQARTTAGSLDLPHVEVRTGDAGLADTYLDAAPAHVLLVCGVFANVPAEDMRRTVAALPALLTEGGIVIWTRSHHEEPSDPSDEIRTCLKDQGFQELAFSRPHDACFRVGMHRLTSTTAPRQQLSGTRLFAFT
ncbi:class I SAM-dependent methyltransferase [Streptomyces sp. NPDC046727]|uniref:class I SAM-dependent methyltransferase n=1 Tax=Streptomyces sp. NPDC046727 TaxID=3155373 RepID=UPI0033D8E7EF